jgi:hypothetical protein
MIQPTFLNALIIGLIVIIFLFMWRNASAALLGRNPESGLAKGMASIYS